MDLTAQELAELEERLYSSIHHANTESFDEARNSQTITVGSTPQSVPETSGYSRVVTDKSVINDARQGNSKMKRYWSSMQQGVKMSYPGIRGNNKPRSKSTEITANEAGGEVIPTKRKSFTPYQSLLGPISGGLNKSNDLELIEDVSGADKPRKKKVAQGDGKRVLNPSIQARNKKLEQLKKIKAKKAKGQKSRQKAQDGQHRLVATIELESSSEEEDGEYRSPDPIKQEFKEQEICHHDLEDSDPDEVVLIPAAPPPLVCIESSDDETAKDGFTHPKTKKKKNAKKTISPRCMSPSNSSIMSDDFIGQSDRTRLNDSFLEGITNDEELDCAVPHTLGSILAADRSATNVSRGTRAPSISSDGTVATSSDTTDQEKRNNPNTISQQASNSKQNAAPKFSSTPKQTLHAKKSTNSSAPTKQDEDDSIYTATSSKRSKATVEKRPSVESSVESDGGNVSSHSKRSKSYQSDASSTKSAKKLRKKRRKHESEHYSDEDFASMLTDIVQAISENEDDGSSDEERPAEVENSVESRADEQDIVIAAAADNTEEHNPDSSNDILEIKDQEPNTISLPQVERREAHITTPATAEDSNDSAVVPIECPPPPVINLADDDTGDLQEAEERITGLRLITDDPEYGWNDEMRKFYHNSWNCEDFNVSTVMFNMSRLNKHWPVVHKDKYPDPPKKEIICNNCGERGHMRYKCRGAPKPRTCYMCGQTGHQEPRCPNTLCLKCGEKTKNFLRGCQSCAREQNMSCHICGVRGHGRRNCPDKWRRYHSTTEDNKPLTQTYVRNPNAKHCCICARVGHQAHMCNAAFKIFGQLVPTTEVKNYQPVYYLNERYRQLNQNDGPKFNLFSEMSDYRLNFDSSFAMNESSFYNRFAKSVGLLDKKKKREEKLARKMKREAKKRKQVDKIMSSDTVSRTSIVYDKECNDTADHPPKKGGSDHVKTANEDSNYSFSEFYEDKSANLPQVSEPMPDYIPLTSNETISKSFSFIAPADVEEQRTDAKIYLTKPHAKILLAPNGATFLRDASVKNDLKVSISFQSVGNVLTANGFSKNQDNFHNELVKFLNDVSHQNEQIKQINNVPKVTEKTVRYIIAHLQMLTRGYGNVKIMFKRYQHFEDQGVNPKTCDKIRRTLNIILFGQYGMREGRDHLNKLQVNLKALKDTKDLNVSLAIRDEINQHIRYIFTSYDHANYADIINEYEDLRKTKKLSKVKPEDLNHHWSLLSTAKLIELTDRDNTNFSEDSFNVSKDLSFDEQNSAIDIPEFPDEDLILNTSDQLIDPSSGFLDRNEESESEDHNVVMPGPSGCSSVQQSPQKSKLNSKQHRIDTLLRECRQMVEMLNSAPITAKFERVQAHGAYMSKCNFRTLLSIHELLKGKLNRKLQSKMKVVSD